jgi:hypothetical protein
MRNYWTRREFARNATLSALAAPFMSIFDPKLAKAQAAGGPAKYLLIFYSNGTDTDAWTPTGSTPTSIKFSTMTEPLAPIASSITLLEHVDSNGTAGNHAAPGGLTGANYGSQPLISLDQFVSDGLRKQGIITQIPNIILGGVPSQTPSTFYRDNRPLSPIASPTAAFQAVFGDGGGSNAAPPMTQGGGMAAMPAGPDPKIKRRLDILGLLTNEIKSLESTLGSFERAKLDVHLASIQQLQDRLNQQAGMPSTSGGSTSGPPQTIVQPVAGCNGTSAGDQGQDLLNSQVNLQLAITAFQCDLTRVAAVEFGHHQGAQVNIPEVGAAGDWHNTYTHGDNPRTRLVNLERWLCERFVDAVNQLQKAGIYDQTMIIWARDMGNAVIHEGANHRYVIAGGAGGYNKTSPNGRYIDVGGDAHLRVLIAAGAAMGITDFTGFGATNLSASARTPLPAISS